MTLDGGEVGILPAFLSQPRAAEHHKRCLETCRDRSFVLPKKFVMGDVDDDEQKQEDRILFVLLEAFPRISLESLASAYTRASGDPDKAAEILSLEMAKRSRAVPPRRRSLEEELGRFGVPETTPKSMDSDEFRRVDDTQQFKSGHGDFAPASVRRNSSKLGSRGRPPDSSSAVTVVELPEVHSPGRRPAQFEGPALEGNSQIGRGKLSATAPMHVFQGDFVAPKVSDVTGSMTSISGDVLNSERELHNVYSGKLEGKNKKGFSDVSCEELEDVAKQIAAEDFLHSMVDGDIGIDVVRDVLGHFAGDTDKALETLLHIGSTSSGFNYSSDTDTEGLHIRTNNHAVLEDAFDEPSFNKVVFLRLNETFPTVELSFLLEVLQAVEFSYGEAVKILKESGMMPIGQLLQPKLNPSEVLHALFRTNLASQDESRISNEALALTAPWSVVAAKPKAYRNLAVPERYTSEMYGGWNDYSHHRTSANEHWTTTKQYMKEAAAAYSWGDRALAAVLSEKGARSKTMAQEASDRASQTIFNVQNKDIENNITIDLHSQHVTEALQLLKLHLRSLSQIPSVQVLTVITGQGSHSAGGQAKIKPALTRYLGKKKIPWKEQNAGCFFINLSDVRALDASRQKSSESSSENESY